MLVITQLLTPSKQYFLFQLPQWGTADAEIKVPSVEKPDVTNILLFKLGVDQNIAMHASRTARN